MDDYTVKFTINEPFPRLAQKFGVTIWGTSYRIVPEHIFSPGQRRHHLQG